MLALLLYSLLTDATTARDEAQQAMLDLVLSVIDRRTTGWVICPQRVAVT